MLLQGRPSVRARCRYRAPLAWPPWRSEAGPMRRSLQPLLGMSPMLNVPCLTKRRRGIEARGLQAMRQKTSALVGSERRRAPSR